MEVYSTVLSLYYTIKVPNFVCLECGIYTHLAKYYMGERPKCLFDSSENTSKSSMHILGGYSLD